MDDVKNSLAAEEQSDDIFNFQSPYVICRYSKSQNFKNSFKTVKIKSWLAIEHALIYKYLLFQKWYILNHGADTRSGCGVDLS